MQEYYLIDDLLLVMTGVDGVYIKKRMSDSSPKSKKKIELTYAVEPHLDQPSCGIFL